jgi:Outer membrane protein beta-barrel domain
MAKINFFIGFLLIIIFCFSTNLAFAQYEEDNEIRTFFGGIMLGVNASQVSGDGITGFHKLGLNVGAMTYIKLSNNIALSMEMLYNEKGSNYWKGVDAVLLNTQGKLYNKYRITLPYAEIPVLLNIFDQRKSNAGLGISYGQLFNNSEVLDSVDISKAFPMNKSDINLIINGSLMLNAHWGINLRYNYSMLNIRKTPNIDLLHRSEQFSRLYSLRCMYLF